MKKIILLVLISLSLNSCKKDWLAEKRDISIIIPSTLDDLRLLLNQSSILNTDTRRLLESSCDDFYVTKSQFASIVTIYEHNSIIWSKDIYQNTLNVQDWDNAYKSIVYTNVILETISKIERTASNAREYDEIKGNALYFRARAFLNLVMTFSKAYDPTTANSDLGIPLKLSADINERIVRATVQQTYDKIVADLISATSLLPSTTKSAQKTDASKPASYGLLARTYLYMGKYDLALQAAGNSYTLKSELIDFNTLNPAVIRPISLQNSELHIYSELAAEVNSTSKSNIIEELYNSYSENDLRKTIFFNKRADGGFLFKGTYTGSTFMNGATATDEMLLISAECKAKLENTSGAMEDLNTLLIKRYKTGTFIPLTASDAKDALSKIRDERRKELVRRGLRFQDLKRYNLEPELRKTLTRTIDGTIYTLAPNDPRYVLPIPDYVIQFNGIIQNQR